MIFPEYPILNEFSSILLKLMNLVQSAWAFLNIPMFPTDPEAVGVLDFLFGENIDPVFEGLIEGFVNLFKYNGVSIGNYSVLTLLISEIVFVVLLLWVVKCFKNLFIK